MKKLVTISVVVIALLSVAYVLGCIGTRQVEDELEDLEAPDPDPDFF